MALVAQGDPHAQRMLAQRLVGRVRRIARHLIGSAADADDGAQVAMVEILQSAHTYRGDASIESWMSRITARTVLRHAKGQRRWYDLFRPRADEPDPQAPAEEDSRDRLPQAIETYLARLPRRHREVLVLKLGLDYTVEEIGEVLALPAGTVKGRLVAGRRKLRALVQRDLSRKGVPDIGPAGEQP